jgi:alkylation response protein AidB-like acyl-CoA dehydrogenase
MDFELTEDQRQVRDLCRDFAEKELRPNARRWDVEHRHGPIARAFHISEYGNDLGVIPLFIDIQAVSADLNLHARLALRGPPRFADSCAKREIRGVFI